MEIWHADLQAGTPAEPIKDRMAQLEARQKQLEADLAATPAKDAALRIHPKMAETYHARIKALITQLAEPDGEGDAREAIRSLIDKIVVTPVPTGGKRMAPQLDLHGALAGILALSLGDTRKPEQQKNLR
ncbi:hypothetical protein ABIE58_003891 [Roseovarius sp. MBR-78]|jgi:hypothetical protein|uniref:hypothetical protein n=1 Tax=Roseovarius sp. MBR-78 TaxID=3156460 RepID=UPI00339AFF2C